MNQKLKEEMEEVIKLIAIERKLESTAITPEEADFVRGLADKKRLPRAEYVLARMHLNGKRVTKDKAVAMKYLARSSRHASYDLLLKLPIPITVLVNLKRLRSALNMQLKTVIIYRKSQKKEIKELT